MKRQTVIDVLIGFACLICCLIVILLPAALCIASWFWLGEKHPANGADIVAVQCPSGGCPSPRSVPGPAAPRTSPVYRWVAIPDDDDQAALYDGDRYIGNWSEKWGYFRPISGNGWGDPCRPPIKPPVPPLAPIPGPSFLPGSLDASLDDDQEELLPLPLLCSAVDDPDPPTGVDREKMGKGPEYEICDGFRCRSVTRRAAMEAIEHGVPDDSQKLRLTIIGSTEDRKRVETDLDSAANADIREKVNLWSVDPSHWSVADVGFVTSGKPTIYLQAPSGKVLGREDSYDGQPTIDAIRKKVESYDAKRDLTIKVQPIVKLDLPWPHILTVGGFGLVAGVLALGRRKQ